MRFKKIYTTSIIALLSISPFAMSTAHADSPSTDYGVLMGIVPELAKYKNTPLYLLPRPNIPVTAPVIPSPTQPIPITSTPSAPGKQPMVRWLLPGGPPPAPNLAPFPFSCYNVVCLN